MYLETMDCSVLPLHSSLDDRFFFPTAENSTFSGNSIASYFLRQAVIPATAANVPSGFLTDTVSIPICFAG